MVKISESISFLKTREAKRQQQLDALFEQAQADVAAIIKMIVAEHAPRRIWKWGSLLDRRKFNLASDIDIALEGLMSAHELFEIHRKADLLTSFPLDIVELERIEPLFADLIRKKGRVVYET